MKSKRQSRPTFLLSIATISFCYSPPVRADDEGFGTTMFPQVTVELPDCPISPDCTFWVDGSQIEPRTADVVEKTFAGSDEVVTVELRDQRGRTIDFQDLPVTADVLRSLQPRLWAVGAGFGMTVAPNHVFRMDALSGNGYSIGLNARRELKTGVMLFEFRHDRESRLGKTNNAIINYSNDGIGFGYGQINRLWNFAKTPYHWQWGLMAKYGRIEIMQSMRTVEPTEEGEVELQKLSEKQRGYEAGMGLRLALLVPATDNVWFPIELAVDHVFAQNQTARIDGQYTRYSQSIGLLFVF